MDGRTLQGSLQLYSTASWPAATDDLQRLLRKDGSAFQVTYVLYPLSPLSNCLNKSTEVTYYTYFMATAFICCFFLISVSQRTRSSGACVRRSCKLTCSWLTMCAWWKVQARAICVFVRKICVTLAPACFPKPTLSIGSPFLRYLCSLWLNRSLVSITDKFNRIKSYIWWNHSIFEIRS